MLTPHPHLQCRCLKLGRAIPLPTLRALVACYWENLYVTIALQSSVISTQNIQSLSWRYNRVGLYLSVPNPDFWTTTVWKYASFWLHYRVVQKYYDRAFRLLNLEHYLNVAPTYAIYLRRIFDSRWRLTFSLCLCILPGDKELFPRDKTIGVCN